MFKPGRGAGVPDAKFHRAAEVLGLRGGVRGGVERKRVVPENKVSLMCPQIGQKLFISNFLTFLQNFGNI